MLARNASATLKTPERSGVETNLFDRPAVVAVIALIGIGLFVWKQLQHLGGVLQFHFPNGDDAMRLLEVRDFLAGQSWFDVTQYRYLPPLGLSMHWSRLLDLPLAGAIAALRPFVGTTLAEGITIATWPPLLFFGYLAVIGYLLRRTAGIAAIGFAILIACQMNTFLFLFEAGRIDHHNVEALLIAVATAGFVLSSRSSYAAPIVGLSSALAIAVSLESLPFVACIAILYVLTWVFRDERSDKSLFAFSAALSLGAIFLYAIQTLPSQWLDAKCDALSPPWLLLACGGGVIATLLTRAAPEYLRTWPARLATAAAMGAALLAIFVLVYPACLHGPYAVIPEPLRTILLDDIAESRSFWRLVETRPTIAFEIFAPVVVAACIASAVLFRKDSSWKMAIALASLSWVAVLLSLVEIRGVYIGSAFVPIAGGWAVHRALTKFATPNSAKAGAIALFGASLFLFGAPWIAGVNIAQAFGFLTGSEFVRTNRCSDSLERLNELPKGTILAPTGFDIPILLHTHHSMVTTGYHRGGAAILAGSESFSGSEDDMRRHARDRHADYVLLCAPWFTDDPTYSASFARALAEGKSVSWLEPVKLETGPLMVWRVRL
jgi:hypothetical protein